MIRNRSEKMSMVCCSCEAHKLASDRLGSTWVRVLFESVRERLLISASLHFVNLQMKQPNASYRTCFVTCECVRMVLHVKHNGFDSRCTLYTIMTGESMFRWVVTKALNCYAARAHTLSKSFGICFATNITFVSVVESSRIHLIACSLPFTIHWVAAQLWRCLRVEDTLNAYDW